MRAALAICVLLAGCASVNGPSYQERLSGRPTPTTEAGKQDECAWIRSEIARKESLAEASSSSQFALAFRAAARQQIAALESRAARLGCRAAFSD